ALVYLELATSAAAGTNASLHAQSSKKSVPGTSTDIKGGGGMTSPGAGTYGDRPPSSLNLFPDRKGFKAGGKGRGTGDSAQKYQPPPKYTANAQYAAVKNEQTVQPYSFKSKSPVVYHASSTRKQFSGAWGFGFYRIYPYPWWAYGSGTWYYAPNQSQP
ncbi:hypothetical protein LPJ70_007806, partial [Coemansia sp. RSA 2708]